MNICDNFRSKYIWHSPTYVELDWMNELWFWICLIPVIPDLVFLENGNIISTLRQVYVFHVLYNKLFIFGNLLKCTVNSTSDYTLWTLYRSYFKDNSANIELNVHTVTCNCFWPYKTVRSMFFFVFLCECGIYDPNPAWVQCWYLRIFLQYCACLIHINLTLESLYLSNKVAFKSVEKF
jgi:hypothetical protein